MRSSMRQPRITWIAAILLGASALCLLFCLGDGPGPRAEDREPIGTLIEVPLDYSHPELGGGTLYFELGAPFDSRKPTVIIVADGQQFYVRKGAVFGLQNKTFGADFNVVGIVGRGFSEDIVRKTVPDPAHVDWALAWRVFSSRQWIEDIDTVRRRLLGNDGRILLYGASGGGFLLHQYLAVHGDHVARAFSSCAPVRIIDAGLHILHDHFWQEIGRQQPGLREKLSAALASHPQERPLLIRTLQRQNFFVTPDHLAAERAALIDEMSRDDSESLARHREEYQVDAIESLNQAPGGASIRVRIYESVQPLMRGLDLFGDAIYPNIENEYHIAKPLLDALAAGLIEAPTLDFAALHRLDTEVFVLAGRLDHTADYRAGISIASMYANSFLFIADDNHMFARLEGSGLQNEMIRTFLKYGLRSDQFRQLIARCEPYRWVERE